MTVKRTQTGATERGRKMTQSPSEEYPKGLEEILGTLPDEYTKNFAAALAAMRPKVGSNDPSDEVHLFVHLSSSTYKELETLARGGSIADAFREAIALSKWFNDTLKSGAKIYVKRDRKLHEVVKI